MKKLTGTFRSTQWDPYLLIAQIVAMQALLYVSLGSIMFVMDLFAEANHTLDHLFEYHVSSLYNLTNLTKNESCYETLWS